MNILVSTIIHHPNIMWTILKNTPTLDPLVILKNTKVYIGYDKEHMVGFLSIKQFGNMIEMGTLYVYPEFRGNGYAEWLVEQAKKDYLELYLLCSPSMFKMYTNYGFVSVDQPSGIMKLRKKLFDLCIAPLVGYHILVMKTK